MEGLMKLEKVQRVITTMKDQNIASGNPEKDRFLAEFFIFMAQPSGTLSMDDKRDLISDHLPRNSLRKLEEACDCVVDEECWKISEVLPSCSHLGCDKEEHPSTGDDLGNQIMVGIEAMQHANSTFEDFCRSYFMFHGMDISNPNTLFKYLPMLFFTESYIYQLDSMNENKLLVSKKNTNINVERSFNHLNGASEKAGNQIEKGCFCKCSPSKPFDSLIFLFRHHGVLTDRIQSELKLGSEYWTLERNLCDSILRKKKVNDLHMEFLSVSELLVEISDDLYDYEEDVIKNSFNVLRMFVKIYGPSLASSMLAKYIAETEDKYSRLSNMIDPNLFSKYQRRCKEATAEGGASVGTWNVPPIIAHEESYRVGIKKSHKN
ncbi:hypothetical protein ZOSMA_96G00170 [Zostera marina]|uniref:Uncharacterized protein n=1 Tax=Zostera marina TaxID=29655 RepID=A0A0K9NI87_ZOSMR|nr:hypothetical protein ZOSMA_96G00170 [Zostera marina]